MDTFTQLLLAVLVAGLALLIVFLTLLYGRFLLWSATQFERQFERWAAGEGYRVLQAERQRRTGLNGCLYVVEDRDGNRRRGFVTFANWNGLLFSDRATVEWQEKL